MVLGDLGAEVIKVEPLTGDNTRQALGQRRAVLPAVQPQQEEHRGGHEKPPGRGGAQELIATADVVSENFKPETMQSWAGLRHAVQAGPAPHLRQPQGLSARPYDHRTALDEVVQMMGGLAYMTGRALATRCAPGAA